MITLVGIWVHDTRVFRDTACSLWPSGLRAEECPYLHRSMLRTIMVILAAALNKGLKQRCHMCTPNTSECEYPFVELSNLRT